MLKVPLGAWLPDIVVHQHWNFRVDPMGGLWRFDAQFNTISELQPANLRTSERRKVFHRITYVKPMELVTCEFISSWRIADIVDKGHYTRPPAQFFLVASSVHHSQFDMFPLPLVDSPANPFDKFNYLLADMNPTRRRQLGVLNYGTLEDDLCKCIQNYMSVGLICVSNGSFNPKLGRGSFAWRISNQHDLYRLSGVGPTDGDPAAMSSYRPELQGILALLILLNTIAQAPISTPVLLVCDNEGATFELDHLINDDTYSLNPKQTDCDILIEIQGELRTMDQRPSGGYYFL